ncbi:MAG TPA: ADP-forming succinate--CoA ligase subunit beta [Chitinivibrionales bacterium]|jgi:succinyl-CoA synthetase beta subunit|nr:ADP-forming succinate--CoA ligase subunit beta [Chitinivibrionales bacterium]
MQLRSTRRTTIKLYEFQARDLLARYGCAIPRGIIASSEKEAIAAAREIGGSVFVKAQVLSGGRGKAGGVKFAASPEEAGKAARAVLSMRIGGVEVNRVLVVQALQIKQEYYIGLTIDRGARCVRCILSAEGGMDIEFAARKMPEKIVSFPLPLYSQTQRFKVTEALVNAFGDAVAADQAGEAVVSMNRLFNEKDCSLVEINPYVLTKEDRLIAADAKIVVDDNALYKHPDMAALRNDEEFGRDELAAAAEGLSFVELDGDIGCMVNGAGLAMATMDLITICGGRPANFLDVGGSSNPQKVVDAFKILQSNKNIKVVLVNIFGGITRGDDIARGIILARQELGVTKPMVVRLTGTSEEQGRSMLAEAGITAQSEMAAAVQSAVAIARAAS